jgi:citrate synthase
MAIPAWVWPHDDGDERDEPARADDWLAASDVEDATDVFETLSNRTRLEILGSLYGRSGPLSYTALRDSTSIEDNGKFNYHLRRLEGFVRGRDGAYALTARGEALARTVHADARERRDGRR